MVVVVVHKAIIVSVRVLCVSLHRLKSFPVGYCWAVHKVIIVSVRVLYVGFLISLVFGFQVLRF